MNPVVTGACAAMAALYAVFCPCLSADTVIMKDGSTAKGVIVEEYKDRFVLSTTEGEAQVMKADVKDLVIDDEETNLLRLADKARDRRDYAGAAKYYERVLALNPGSESAKKGLLRAREAGYRRAEAVKFAPAGGHDEPDKFVSFPIVGKRGEEVEVFDRHLYGVVGLRLKSEEGCYKISAVRKESPAARAGIRKGDSLISVQGRLVCYSPLPDVARLILRRGDMSIGCSIERALGLELRRGPAPLGASGVVGATLYLGSEGITVRNVRLGSAAMAAGMENGDIVTAINGERTRYMPLAKANGMILSSKEGRARMTVRRDVVIWKEGRP